MKTINLKSPITVTITDSPVFPNQPAPKPREVSVSSLTLRTAIDDPILKRVMVNFFETRFPVTIWKDEAYDAAGQWTQEQLEQAVSDALALDPVKIVNDALKFPDFSSPELRKTQSENLRKAFPKGVPRPVWLPVTNAISSK